METNAFNVPNFEFSTAAPEIPPIQQEYDPEQIIEEHRPKHNPADNLKKYREKKKLSKVNRELDCPFCGEKRILNPNQYQSYYDYWGDEDKIKRNFICKPCEVKQNENPFLFWLQHHESTRKANRALKAVFELYKSSRRTQEDILALQNMTVNVMSEYKIDPTNIEFITENNLPTAIRIKHMPFVGTFEFKPYNEVKINIV
jgi:hypothetical protein